MSLLDRINDYLKEEYLGESFKEIFSKKRFKTDKEVTDWITHLTPGTIVDIDVVGPQSKKILIKKGTKISSNKKGTTGNYKNIYESEDILLEDRRSDLNYKEKLVKGQIDRVTVELEAHESGVMTKLASRYFSIDKTIKKLMEVKDKMNAGVKERAEALFNAEDIVLTRVVETVSFGLTLSKQMQVAESTVERVNYEKIAKELMALISEDLKPQVDAIIKEATTKTVIPASTKSPGLRITPKNEGFVGDAVNKFKELVLRFKSWAKGYDKKLNELKRKL